jgi:hypothetical protein
MTLDIHATYLPTQAYVVKLHRDSVPQNGRITGRLEHIASGRTVQFSSAEELIARLLADAASVTVTFEGSGS